jgi:hypothetical protein
MSLMLVTAWVITIGLRQSAARFGLLRVSGTRPYSSLPST